MSDTDDHMLSNNTVDVRNEERRARLQADYWAWPDYEPSWDDGPDFTAADLYLDPWEQWWQLARESFAGYILAEDLELRSRYFVVSLFKVPAGPTY